MRILISSFDLHCLYYEYRFVRVCLQSASHMQVLSEFTQLITTLINTQGDCLTCHSGSPTKRLIQVTDGFWMQNPYPCTNCWSWYQIYCSRIGLGREPLHRFFLVQLLQCVSLFNKSCVTRSGRGLVHDVNFLSMLALQDIFLGNRILKALITSTSSRSLSRAVCWDVYSSRMMIL